MTISIPLDGLDGGLLWTLWALWTVPALWTLELIYTGRGVKNLDG